MLSSLIVQVPHEPPYEVRLDRDVVSVGRADDNVLPLRDMNVSRHHFAIERRGEYWIVSDRKSRNGTLVNGVSVLNKVLVEGDRVQAGGSQLTFRAQATPRACSLGDVVRNQVAPGTPLEGYPISPKGATAAQKPPELGAAPPPTKPFLRNRAFAHGMHEALARSGFGLSPQPAPGAPAPAAPPAPGTASPEDTASPGTQPARAKDGTRSGVARPRPSSRVARASAPSDSPSALEEDETFLGNDDGRRWRLLADVACAINVVQSIDQLLEEILDAVLVLVPAKSAYLVLVDRDELLVEAHRNAPRNVADAGDSTIEAFRLSRQVCREAIEKGHPMLTQDAVSDEELNQFVSVINLQLKSILCVPFSYKGEALGVVYLDEPACDPFADEGEEVELVGAFGDLAGIALANARMLLEVKERERLEQEIAIAGRIQRSLLPSGPPICEGIQLAGETRAARHVGGDVYDFFTRESPCKDVLIAIGDVAGKGVGAGLVMASVRALIHAQSEIYERTDDLLVALNRVLSPDLDPGIFVSYLLLRYDPATGQLHYSGAGHEHLIVLRANGESECIRAGGVVLGLLDDLSGRITEASLTLNAGDILCLYTDGATEAPDLQGEEFGLERVVETVRNGPGDPASVVERVIAAVDAFSEGTGEQHDDLTVVALRKR